MKIKKQSHWKTSRILLNESWKILLNQTGIIKIPLQSFFWVMVATLTIGILSLVLAIGFDFTGGISGTLAGLENSTSQQNTFLWIGGIIITIVNQIIITYFNAGIIHKTNAYLSGENISNKEAFIRTKKRRKAIYLWATINATAGIILRQITERSRILGKIIATLVGVAWNILTYFMLPIIVLEELDIKQSAKKSTAIIKETWGEAFLTNIGVGLAMSAFVFIGIIVFAGLMLTGSPIIMIAAGVLLSIYIIGIAIVSSILNTIVKVMIYRYANKLPLPETTTQHDLLSMFQKK